MAPGQPGGRFGKKIGYHYIRLDNSVFEMKKYIIESLVSGAIYCIGLLALDARPGHQFKAAGFYLISSVIFGLLFSLVMRLIQKRIGKKSDKK